MKRASYALLFLSLLWIVTTDFSGCKGGLGLGVQANAKNGSKTAALAPEPDVTFQDLQGNKVTLASLKGKVVVVDFWQTYCEPCQVEIPWLIEFQQKYASKGFTIVGVAMDDEGKTTVAPFVQKTQFDVDGHSMAMNYPIVIGSDAIGDEFGGLFGYPTNFVISRDGKIVKKHIGLIDHDDFEQEIKNLL